MFLRWIARAVLAVAAFFVGNLAMFLAVGNFFWSTSGQSQEFPTPQDWLDIITTTTGVALAVVVWIASRRLTTPHPDDPASPTEQRS